MSRLIEYVLAALVFATICISALGIHTIQANLAPAGEERLAPAYLHAIKDAFGGELAAFSDEYRDFNPARHVDYPTLRDTLGAEVGFSLSLRQPIEVSVRVEGTDVAIHARYASEASAPFRVTMFLLYPDRIEEVRLGLDDAGRGSYGFDEAPEAIVAFAHDSAATGFGKWNVERGRGYADGAIHILDAPGELYVLTRSGWRKHHDATLPRPAVVPALVVYREGATWRGVEYPHLFALGIPGLEEGYSAYITIDGSPFVLEVRT